MKNQMFQRSVKGFNPLRCIAALTLCAGLLVTACGCGDTDTVSAAQNSVEPTADGSFEPRPATEAPIAPTDEAERKAVGITQIVAHASLDNCRAGFIEGLKQGGYVDGVNVDIHYQDAQGEITLADSIAKQFINEKVDLICAIATPSAIAAANAAQNTGIPVVFNAVSEPVESGLIASFENTGGNITGVSDKLPVEKQLQLIRDLLPQAQKVGILYTTSETNSMVQLAQFEAVAAQYDLEIVATGITASNEISTALDALLPQVDCVQNLTDNTVVAALPLFVSKAKAHNIPVFGSEEEQVRNGCLASEGIDYIQLGIQCGLQAAKILDGEDPRSIPAETIKESKLTINEDVLAELGITLPEDLSLRAEMVKFS